MKVLIKLLALVACVCVVSAQTQASFTFTVKAVNDKEVRQGQIAVTAMLIETNSGRNVSNGMPAMGRFVLPAGVSRCYLRLTFFLSDFLDRKSYRKDGTIDATLELGLGNNRPVPLSYSVQDGGWYQDVDLTTMKPGFYLANAYLVYKAGRNHSGLIIPLVPDNWLVAGRTATQRASTSAIFPVVMGAPDDPDKIIEWQYQIEEKYPGAFPYSYTLQAEMVADQGSAQFQPDKVSTTTEVEETSFQVVSATKTLKVTAQSPIGVKVDYCKEVVLEVGGKAQSLRTISRQLSEGRSLTFPKISGVTFTVNSNGKSYQYDDQGRLIR